MSTRYLYRYLVVLAVMAIALAACGAQTPSATSVPSPVPATPTTTAGGIPDDFELKLEREPCFGFCPTYTLTVRADGTVVFEGLQNVEATGTQTATLTPEQMAELVKAVERADYFALKDEYTAMMVTDHPYVNSAVTLNGQRKSIRHYHGDDSAPAALGVLEQEIDQIVNSAQWVGTR